jgi:hypothetical protein
MEKVFKSFNSLTGAINIYIITESLHTLLGFNSLTGVINIAEKYLKKGDLISFQFLN